jgi:hypothetical protein
VVTSDDDDNDVGGDGDGDVSGDDDGDGNDDGGNDDFVLHSPDRSCADLG